MTRGDIIEVVTNRLTDDIEEIIWETFNASPDMRRLTPFELIGCAQTAAFNATQRYHQTRISAIGGKTLDESYEEVGV
jgi:hypothetical protein